MKRNILNYLGDVVGELELPDETPEEVWAAQLAVYATAPVFPPIESVTPRQIRLALIHSGIPLQAVNDAIAALPSPHREMAEVEWEYATTVERNNPLVDMIATANSMSSADIDAFFKLAATL